MQVVELQMCALSNHIREKPNWWEKVKDETIVEKWRQEAMKQQEDEDREASRKMSSEMVSRDGEQVIPFYGCLSSLISMSQIKYVLEELHGYAELRDSETGIEVRKCTANCTQG